MTYDLSVTWTIVLLVALAWEFFWKGKALWRAAHLNQPVWFGVMLVVGSIGLLPMLYLLFYHPYGRRDLRHHHA